MENESVTLTDNRTGKSYTLPLFKGCIRSMDLRQIKVSDQDFGVMGYDPAFMNTASCQSAITFIDGDRGILRYRGIPDRATGGELLVSGSLLSDSERRIAFGGPT